MTWGNERIRRENGRWEGTENIYWKKIDIKDDRKSYDKQQQVSKTGEKEQVKEEKE